MQGVAADRRLEVAAGAFGDHPPVIDHRQPFGEAIGLLQVLGREQHGGSVGGDLADEIPHLVPAARIETRRRFVQEEDLGRGDQAGGDVDAAPHAARISPHLLAGRVREPERARAARWRACARPSRTGRGAGSPAPGSRGRSRSSSTDAYCPVRLTFLRTAAASATTSWPSTTALPLVGLSSVVSTRIVVVFPAPFGPRRPYTLPLRIVRIHAVEGPRLPERLHEAGGLDRGRHGGGSVAPRNALSRPVPSPREVRVPSPREAGRGLG